MNQVKQFIQSVGGRGVIRDYCGVTYPAVMKWEVNNEIPRDYLPSLEKLARDKKCFRVFTRAAGARGEYNCGGKK